MVDLKDLFNTTIESNQLLKSNDKQLGKDQTKAAKIIFKDIFMAYEAQKQYATIIRTHLHNNEVPMNNLFLLGNRKIFK